MKRFLRIALIPLGLILIVWLVLAIFAEPIIKKGIEQKLTYYPEDTVSIGSVNLSFFPLGLKLKDIHFKLQIPKDSTLLHWEGNLSYAKVGGLKWAKAFKENTWDVAKLKIGEGSIHWKKVQNDSIMRPDRQSSLPDTRPVIVLQNTSIEQMDLKFERDSLTIQLQTSMILDSLGLSGKDKMQWGLKRIQLHSKNATFENIVADFDLAYKNLFYDSNDHRLLVAGFAMKPRINHAEFAQKYPFRKVQPDIYISSIAVNDMRIDNLHHGIFASTLVLDSCSFNIYQDIRKEREDVRKALPSELIAKISIPVAIDSVLVKRAFLHYRHTSQKPELGKARLEADDVSFKIFPITNIGHPVSAEINILASARLQQRARVNLKAILFADKTHHDFEVHLNMGSTPIVVFNDILYPTTGIKIKGGSCSGARVYMRGNDYSIRGDLDIAYSNLKIDLPPSSDDKPKIFSKVKSGLGNLALVNTNLSYDSKGGSIYYERPAKEPFVNYWWKGIQSGLIDAIVKVDIQK